MIEMLKYSSVGRSMRTAIENGDIATAKDFATRLVQARWRNVLAKRKAVKLRLEKENLVLVSSAMRIQRVYRRRRAMKKASTMHDILFI